MSKLELLSFPPCSSIKHFSFSLYRYHLGTSWVFQEYIILIRYFNNYTVFMHNTFLCLIFRLLDFDSEYQELWDWLIDMESLVMDSHDLMMSEEQQQQLYKVRASLLAFTLRWKIWLVWQVFPSLRISLHSLYVSWCLLEFPSLSPNSFPSLVCWQAAPTS